MSEKYNSRKQEEIDAKHQPGKKVVSYVKSSDYIPSVFKTDLNEKWFDSTFDQMLHKGDLNDVDEWIETGTSSLRSKTSLAPAIVSVNADNTINASITFDDVLRNINQGFDEYNLNAAYQSKRLVYMPPISIKKFDEYLSYYWTPDVPVYTSSNTIDLSAQGNLVYEFDGFFVEDGMVIKDSTDITYIVSGVGSSVKFIEYADASGTQLYTDLSDIVTYTEGLSFENNPDVTHFNQLDKDYIVISRADADDTAWSRSNHWIAESTLRKIIDLVESDLAVRDELYAHYLSDARQAKRPIIEFNPNIEKIASEKVSFSQAPKFVLFDADGNRLDDETIYPQNTFVSSTIFSYKAGNSIVDAETGLQLSYSDTGRSSDIVFENTIVTERVKYTTLDENNRSTGEIFDVEGLYYFKQDEILKTIYVPSEVNAGAVNTVRATATGVEQNIDVRATEWDKISKFTFRECSTGFMVDKTMNSGVCNISNTRYPIILIAENSEYEFVNVLTEQLQIGSETISSSSSYVGTPSSLGWTAGNVYTIEDPSNVGHANVIVVENDACFYHTVFVNGKKLECVPANYTIAGDSIVIVAGKLQSGDVIDIEYTLASNHDVYDSTLNLPDTLNNNANNELIEEITLSDTIAHWDSIDESMPASIFESMGLYNLYLPLSPSKRAGTIFITEDTSIQHDIAYADTKTSISSALNQQAADWQRFKTRVAHQAVRKYKTDIMLSTAEEIMVAVLDEYTLTRQGTSLYIDSGMLTTHPDYIPQSIVKLGIGNIIEPYIDSVRNVLVGHDGSEYAMNSTDVIDDLSSPLFNAKAAVLFELETAVYNTITNSSNTISEFMPTISRKTWYNSKIVDDYIARFFASSVKTPEYGFGKNYSTLIEHSSQTGYEVYAELDYLPGTWEGAYNTLFGTHRPHREPWVMVGFGSKPSWWSDIYPIHNTWNDGTKVDALKLALKTGIVNGVSVPRVAKYSWDWDTRFPVDSNGDLVDVDTVLDPSGYALETEYVYGDWAGDELVWRLSAEGQASMADAIVKMNPTTAWTRFGDSIKLAQKNSVIRNSYDVNIDEFYSSIDTKLAHKMGGFTSKHLLYIESESSKTGKYDITSGDYNLVMYRSAPETLVTASVLKVTRETSGTWKIDGISPSKQQFEFFPVATSGSNDFDIVTLSSGATIKRYSKFAKVTNTVEFGTTFKRVQDVYNIIIGNRLFLESIGYYASNKDAVANEFARWSVTAEVGETYTVELGDSVLFANDFGFSQEMNTLPLSANSVFDTDGNIISSENLTVTRNEDNIVVRATENIGSITISVVEYEHVAIFNDRTTFNSVIFDKKLNLRQERMRLEGQITEDWNGKKRAPGFLVFEDKIVQNFDSSVSAVEDYYSYNTVKFNESIEKTENLTIGNIQRDWSESFSLGNNTVGKFYQGVIRDKGTKDVVNRIDRSSEVNLGNSDISIDEEWMFRQGFFGSTTSNKSAEYEIRASDLTSRNQGILFASETGLFSDEANVVTFTANDIVDGHKRVVNYSEVYFDETDYDPEKLHLNIAGELRDDEADKVAFSLFDLPDVYDETADYANIQTWNNAISYNRGDMVRYQGKLWKCNVSHTGLTVISDGVTITGTSRNAQFPDASTATINGITTTFGKETTTYLPIVVESTVAVSDFPSFAGAEIILDGVSINIESLGEIELIKSYPTVLGTVTNPVLADRDGKTLIIDASDGTTVNTVTVDFSDIANPDEVENFTASSTYQPNPIVPVENITGVASQSTYTITETFDTVTSVTIDGAPETDYTVVGSDITFNTFTFVGGEDIEITMALADIEIKQDEFVVAQALGTFGSITYELSDVEVNGTSVGYSVFGQTVTLDTPAEDGDNVTVFINVISTAVLSDIVDIINNQVSSVPGLIAQDDNGRVRITYNIPDNTKVNSSITISYEGTANTDIGFSVDVNNETESQASSYIYYGQNTITLDSVVSSINNSILIEDIVAQNVEDKLVITKSNVNAVNNTLVVAGNTLDDLHINADTYTAITSISRTSSTAIEAVSLLNESHVASPVTFTLTDGSIKVSSPDNTIDMGDESNEFNDIAGLPHGTIENINTSISNTGPTPGDGIWQDVSYEDAALFNVWITDDSALGYEILNNIQVRYNDWNLFQFMNMGWFANDSSLEDGCSICAGTATSDGNDAEVTLNQSHNLQVGDIVMLLNTTTTPNIDGIHTVTRISAVNDRVFYIDRFIEKCGTAEQVLLARPVRFNTTADRDALVGSAENLYELSDGDIVFVSNSDVRSSNVYEYNNAQFDFVRGTSVRPNADSLRNIRIYDAITQNTSVEMEMYDPLRGIIPGVADREITFRSPIDFAVYTNSTSGDIHRSTDVIWSSEQVGQVWWDTSTVKYYDYDQSTIGYSTRMWGKQFPGSSVDVYEWTKSSVTPDMWSKAVEAGTEMYGEIASGEVYKIYDVENAEFNYFYTEVEEWNRSLGKYQSVYYFWVKNKNSVIDSKRNLTVKQIADIIDNPTEAGINWCAVTGKRSIVMANFAHFVADEGSVIQVNLVPNGVEHNNWTSICEDKDLIPEYWYIRSRDNLVGYTSNEVEGEILLDRRIPDIYLNKYNRYGDDSSIGQGWFEDIWLARRESLDVANTLLSDMNVYHELPATWWRNITRQVVRGTWDWKTYVHASRNSARMPSMRIASHAQLFDENNANFVDASEHQVVAYSVPSVTRIETPVASGQVYSLESYTDEIVSLTVDGTEMIENRDWAWIDSYTIEFLNEASTIDKLIDERELEDIIGGLTAVEQAQAIIESYGIPSDPARGIEITGGEAIVIKAKTLDRSEIFEYIDGEWILAEKKNSAIKFNDLLWKAAQGNAWDMQGWDTFAWDNNYGEAAYYIIKALREDLFIQDFIENFNKWFLGTTQYAISEHTQVDWMYKTTYISANVETPIDTTRRKYTRNNIDDVESYITDVKPFHTKIKTMYDINTVTEELAVSLLETGPHGGSRPALNITARFEELYLPEFVEDTISSTFGETEDFYTGGSFVSEPTDAVNGATFLDNILINSDTLSQPYNNTLAEVMPSESFAMVVQTDGSVDSERRTMVYLQDKNNIRFVFGLEDANSTTIATSVSPQDSIISVADASAFSATGGFAYYNGSVIRYAQVIDNDLISVTYEVLGTYAKSAEVGDIIVDVTNSELTFTESDILQFNDIDEVSGKYEKLLESNTNVLPQELQALGQGVNF